MQLNVFKKLKQESEEYNIPIWKLPDFILLAMGIICGFVMIVTYAWASNLADDPREAVLIVAAEAALIMIVGNVIVESAKRMSDINKMRKEFVQIVSHQLRSPLTTVRWYMEMFNKREKNNLTEKQQRYLDEIFKESEKMRTMIEDMLNVTILEGSAEGAERIKDKVDLVKVINECLEVLDRYAEIRKIKIDFRAKNKKCIVRGDRKKLKVVIMNLIENAVHYSHDGKKVVVEIDKLGEKVNLMVRDFGIGILPKDQKHIFSKFYRGKNARKAQPQGTGLGLFVSKKIIEQLGGKISLKSASGEGTTFFLEIPTSSEK